MINPNFVKIPESWKILRQTVQPKENYKEDSFGKTFDETYDYDTLFSGVVKVGKNVVITAPPFMNLKKFINENVKITDGQDEIHLVMNDLDRCGVAYANVSDSATHLYLYYEDEDPLEVEIEKSLIEEFADKKILFTMFKNDSKESILHWIQYHKKVYSIDGFVLFNNNSDKYTTEEIQEYLKSDDYIVEIVDWPMRWGVVGPPWDADFCKIVGLQYLKYKFAFEAHSVLNLDVDEYFCSPYGIDDIISAMEQQKKDTINMESKNISRYTTAEDPHISDYYWWHDDQVNLNKMTKWITNPKKSRDYHWTTHYVFSPNREETEDFYYAHLSCLVGEHHINNATEVARKRFIIKETGNKKNILLKKNYEIMKNTVEIDMTQGDPILMEAYKQFYEMKSEINEHLPTLYSLAKQCDSVCELGVCHGKSSRALLASGTKLRSYDVWIEQNVKALFEHAKSIGNDVEYIKENSIKADIEECDMLFIDTWHHYYQLRKELELHADKAKKWIVMHDTVSFGSSGEKWTSWGNGNGKYAQYGVDARIEYEELCSDLDTDEIDDIGINSAIFEFLSENPQWRVKKHYKNNSGLTVLERHG